MWLSGGELGEGRWMNAVKRYKLPVVSTKDIMYNMINVINTAVCSTLKRINPEFSSQEHTFVIVIYLFKIMAVH